MYRKVPGDLVEGSKQGSVVSWMAIFTIVFLFYKETADYFTTKLVSNLTLDRRQSKDDMIKVNFNITMMDLRCDHVEVDVVSVLGNNQNVTKYVDKFPLDAEGVVHAAAARNMRQHDIEEMLLHDSSIIKSIEDLQESGEQAVSLDETTLGYAIRENDLVFVDFFAGWCSHCQALAPTWEVLAKVMYDATEETVEEGGEGYGEGELQEAEKLDVPVIIAKVDCVEHHELCVDQNIRAYPTLRLFFKGEPFEGGDYRGHRTILDMLQFLRMAEEQLDKEGKLSADSLSSALEKHLEMSVEEKHWAEAFERTRKHHHRFEWNPEDHPGCQLSGTLHLHRVPGNFYIEAFSPTHDLAPHMTNVSHEVHSLSFEPADPDSKKKGGPLPPNFYESTTPMNGNIYITHNLHESFHHYIKLISTNGNFFQVLQSSQLASYDREVTPEAKFIIDLSPIAVEYQLVSRHWYDYFTSLMGIIGGTFTCVGFLQSGIRAVATARRKRISHTAKTRHVY
jgi:thiol-disulfide isomerase/thioredoxin